MFLVDTATRTSSGEYVTVIDRLNYTLRRRDNYGIHWKRVFRCTVYLSTTSQNYSCLQLLFDYGRKSVKLRDVYMYVTSSVVLRFGPIMLNLCALYKLGEGLWDRGWKGAGTLNSNTRFSSN